MKVAEGESPSLDVDMTHNTLQWPPSKYNFKLQYSGDCDKLNSTSDDFFIASKGHFILAKE